MKANVVRGVDDFGLEEVERPRARGGEAVIRVTLTTICGAVTYDLAADGSASLRVREGTETTTVPAAWEIVDDRVQVMTERDGREVSELWALVEGEALTGTLLYRVDE